MAFAKRNDDYVSNLKSWCLLAKYFQIKLMELYKRNSFTRIDYREYIVYNFYESNLPPF